MHFPSVAATVIFSLVTSTSALPQDSLLSRSDGAYTVQFNDDGTRHVLNFVASASISANESLTLALERSLVDPRGTATTCEGVILDQPSLVNAWNGEMNYLGAGVNLGSNQVVYTKAGSVVVYACSYTGSNTFTAATIQNALTAVSSACGDLTSGYERCKAACGTADSTIGRKQNGADFCWPGFKG
ncbi:hypothetical protein F4782DRAFT_531816 [Xylaria castorea]|nr:hypothetical protein F4782DRAFT_531816 [Xylaria castorea]